MREKGLIHQLDTNDWRLPIRRYVFSQFSINFQAAHHERGVWWMALAVLSAALLAPLLIADVPPRVGLPEPPGSVGIAGRRP